MKISSVFNREPIGDVPETEVADLKEIIEKAENFIATLDSGPSKPVTDLLLNSIKALDAKADNITRLLSAETGMPLRLASMSFQRFLESLSVRTEVYEPGNRSGGTCGSPRGQFSFSIDYTVGIVVAITSFSDPLGSLSRILFPALAARVPVVIKPSSSAVLSVLSVIQTLQRSGLQEGAIQAVIARRSSAAVEQLLLNRNVSMVFAAGSPASFLALQEKHPLGTRAFELYSSSTALVLHASDLDLAASAIAGSFTRFQGQAPGRIQRVLVDSDSFDYLVNRISEELMRMKAGDPSDRSTDISRLSNQAKEEEFASISIGKFGSAAAILYGGGIKDGIPVPLVLEYTEARKELWEKDVMLPLLIVRRFSSSGEAISIANSIASRWCSYAYTDDLNDLNLLSSRLDFGRIYVNSLDTYWPGGQTFISGYTGANGKGIQGISLLRRREVQVEY